MIHLADIKKTDVSEEIVLLAAKHTNLDVLYKDIPVESGDLSKGSIWTNEKEDVDLGIFWEEFDRLQRIITEPLKEPILPDDYPVYQGYLYVVNGNRVVEFIDGGAGAVSVGQWKAMNIHGVRKVTEVRRCDIVGRQLRLPIREEKLLHDISPFSRRKHKKPKRTNKIKKHMVRH
jgi:hypothetical protein